MTIFRLPFNFSYSIGPPALGRTSPLIRFFDMLNGSLLEGGWFWMLWEALERDRPPVVIGAASATLEVFSSVMEPDKALNISGVILNMLFTRMLTPTLCQLRLLGQVRLAYLDHKGLGRHPT